MEDLKNFQLVDDLIHKNNGVPLDPLIDAWENYFDKIKPILTSYNKEVLSRLKNKENPTVLLSITTCKRLTLFKETINSVLNTWTDLHLVDHFFLVDDNSSEEDRQVMVKEYPFFEFHMKTPEQKGHRASMNTIFDKLNLLKPDYWVHLEDDFLFYHKGGYITKAIDGLKLANDEGYNVKQMLFNRNYGEIVHHFNEHKGHLNLKNTNDFVIHSHKRGHFEYLNHHYWAHYSFRPSLVETEAVLSLGNFNSENAFFEMDYANRWVENGYQSAFFNRVTCIHTGKLTTNKGVNAYDLNGQSQFGGTKPQNNYAIKVVNLERRPDRKMNTQKVLDEAHLSGYEFVKAVDGSLLQPSMEIMALFKTLDHGYRKGVMGCALSHINLWRSLLDDPVNQYYVILEDDITLAKETHFNSFENKDLVFLGYHMYSKHEEYYKAGTPRIQPLNMGLYIGGFFAYAINKSGAKKLLDYITVKGVPVGIDIVPKLCKGLHCFETFPHMVFSEMHTSINNVDTNIQDNFDRLDLNGLGHYDLNREFVFFNKLDHSGDDLYSHRNLSIEECMLMCLRDAKCVGFNTLGFFKSEIDNLRPSQYFHGKNDGIFIKRTHFK